MHAQHALESAGVLNPKSVFFNWYLEHQKLAFKCWSLKFMKLNPGWILAQALETVHTGTKKYSCENILSLTREANSEKDTSRQKYIDRVPHFYP